MSPLLTSLAAIGCDVSGGLQRFVGNEALYLKYLYRFKEEPSPELFIAAMHRTDYEDAYFQLHTLKGVSGNLGLTGLFTLSQKILLLLKEQDYAAAALHVPAFRQEREKLIGVIARHLAG